MRPFLTSKQRRVGSFLATGLLLYLLLFSSFALFHAYSEGELIDPHQCTIGLWVHQAPGPVTFLAALAVFLTILFRSPLPKLFLPATRRSLQKATRAPPFTLLSVH